MTSRTTCLLLAFHLLPAALAAAVSAAPVPLAELSRNTHFHGIAVDARDPERVYLATHHGLFVLDASGMADRVSDDGNDYMGFTPHPSDPDILYASGHPAGGGNLGFIVSSDGGQSWRQLSPGVGGPVDFHQMDVSKADPNVIYGSFRGLQASRDGGRTWNTVAPLPDGLIDLAASATDPARVYAATKGGLMVSTDAGASWKPAHMRRSPASMVQTGFSGEVYAFLLGAGLLRTDEPNLAWEVRSNAFGEGYLLHLAVDPGNPQRLFAITGEGAVMASTDGGATWRAVGG